MNTRRVMTLIRAITVAAIAWALFWPADPARPGLGAPLIALGR